MSCQTWCEQHETDLTPEVCTTRPVIFSARDSLWMSQGTDEPEPVVILQVGHVDHLLTPDEAGQLADLVAARPAELAAGLLRVSALTGTVRA